MGTGVQPTSGVQASSWGQAQNPVVGTFSKDTTMARHLDVFSLGADLWVPGADPGLGSPALAFLAGCPQAISFYPEPWFPLRAAVNEAHVASLSLDCRLFGRGGPGTAATGTRLGQSSQTGRAGALAAPVSASGSRSVSGGPGSPPRALPLGPKALRPPDGRWGVRLCLRHLFGKPSKTALVRGGWCDLGMRENQKDKSFCAPRCGAGRGAGLGIWGAGAAPLAQPPFHSMNNGVWVWTPPSPGSMVLGEAGRWGP